MYDDTYPLDESRLGTLSKQLSHAVFSVFPQFKAHARMMKLAESDGLSLTVNIPSPTGDDKRNIYIWVDEVVTPSVGLGPSHYHESADGPGIAMIVETIHRIVEGKTVIIEDIGGAHPGSARWFDLDAENALSDELTGPYSPGHVYLKSWTGDDDREVRLSDLTI